MKSLLISFCLVTSSAFAQYWSETYDLPAGITHRARTVGYDCGTFGSKYVEAPSNYKSYGIEFKQLAADKDLNTFLFEAIYPSSVGDICTYGVYFDRTRDTKTLDFNRSVIQSSGDLQSCEETKSFLDQNLQSLAYEASKRGIRYIAAQIIKEQQNDVCETGNVRIVFDRRFVE